MDLRLFVDLRVSYCAAAFVGAAGAGQDAGPGTDFHAVANGFVSITPLQVDLTRHSALDSLREWLREPAGP